MAVKVVVSAVKKEDILDGGYDTHFVFRHNFGKLLVKFGVAVGWLRKSMIRKISQNILCIMVS